MKAVSRDIQKEILTRLIGAPALRYSEARPVGVANDLYNYHLQFLVKKGLVAKQDDQYFLSEEGKYFIGKAQPLNPVGRRAELVKAAVLTVVVDERPNGLFVLYQTRKRHPHFGYECIMGGTIRNGEPILSAATRKLKEESGLDAAFRFVGVARKVVINDLGKCVSDTIFHICGATKWRGELADHTVFGDQHWMHIDEAIALENHDDALVKAMVQVLVWVKTNQSFVDIPFLYTEEQATVSAGY